MPEQLQQRRSQPAAKVIAVVRPVLAKVGRHARGGEKRGDIDTFRPEPGRAVAGQCHAVAGVFQVLAVEHRRRQIAGEAPRKVVIAKPRVQHHRRQGFSRVKAAGKTHDALQHLVKTGIGDAVYPGAAILSLRQHTRGSHPRQMLAGGAGGDVGGKRQVAGGDFAVGDKRHQHVHAGRVGNGRGDFGDADGTYHVSVIAEITASENV